MTETSFPVVEKPLTEAQWGTIAHSFGQGIIDRGGFPYRLGTIDDVADTVTIELPSIEPKRNEAIVRGFAHSIDHVKTLSLPAVATETTYEIGLVYNPAGHGTTAGPVTLDVWTAPGTTVGGIVRIVLYRVTRKPSSALSTATRVENRQRISPQIVVTATADLPPTSAVLVDTVARVRVTGERWAAAIDGTTGVVSWVKIDSNSDLANATYLPTGDTLAKRSAGGIIRVNTGTHSQDAANVAHVSTRLDDALGTGWVKATWAPTPEAVMRRGSDGAARVEATSAHPQNIVNVGLADARYAGKSHTHPGGDITSRVPYEHVDGSRAAYDTIQSGTVYTVSVNSTGDFMRFSSKRADKDFIEPLTADPRRLLAPVVVQYRRRDSTGEVPANARVEWGFIADDELARAGGTPELVLTEVDETGKVRPEGWDNGGLTAAHHRVLQWLADRADRAEIRATRAEERITALEKNTTEGGTA